MERGRIALGFNEDLALANQLPDLVAWRSLIAADADLHRQAGSTILRTPMAWAAVERTPGRYDFTRYDILVEGMAAKGVRVLFNLVAAPDWALDPVEGRCRPTCTTVPPAARHEAAWGRFVAAVAKRYGDKLVGLEVWNEPNSVAHWQGAKLDPERYTRLLCAASDAVERTAPAVPLGGAVVSNAQESDARSLRMTTFLDRMFRAGAARCMDALSFHPYPVSLRLDGTRSTFARTFADVRSLRDRHAPGLRLWPTEIGLEAGREHTAQDQATLLARAYEVLDRGPDDDVDLMIVHTLVALASTPGGTGYATATWKGGFTFEPGPAIAALRRATGG